MRERHIGFFAEHVMLRNSFTGLADDAVTQPSDLAIRATLISSISDLHHELGRCHITIVASAEKT